MKTVGAREANQNFSKLLREVEAGEGVSITRNGEEVARILPPENGELQHRVKRRMALAGFLEKQAKARHVGRVLREDIYADRVPKRHRLDP